jgi:hypothetical protein
LSPSELAGQVFAPLINASGPTLPPEEFVAVPGGAPRWLIPNRHGEAHELFASWSPYRSSSRLKWAAIRAANRAGALAILPNAAVVSVASLADVDWKSWGWEERTHPVTFVYVGTPGPARKCVVHLVEPASGECRSVLKVPLTEMAKAAILRDADVLNRLAAEGYACAPRVLLVDRERGIAAHSFLAGTPGSRTFKVSYRKLLTSLLLPGEWTSLSSSLAELQPALADDRLPQPAIVAQLLPRLADTSELPACWLHRDFAPWNIREVSHDEAALLDWEDACRGGLPLQDALHFLHIQNYLFSKRPKVYFDCIRTMVSGAELSEKLRRLLETAYLLRSYFQQKACGNQEHANFLLNCMQLVRTP